MNKREALRFAAGELADLAAGRGEDYQDPEVGIPDERDGDRARVIAAFEVLRGRLEFTASGVRDF